MKNNILVVHKFIFRFFAKGPSPIICNFVSFKSALIKDSTKSSTPFSSDILPAYEIVLFLLSSIKLSKVIKLGCIYTF